MTRRSRSVAAWFAFLAIVLQSAWPLLAQAKPASVALVPLCSVAGVTHYVEVPLGGSPADEQQARHSDHCAFCFLGGDRAMAPLASPFFQSFDVSFFPPPGNTASHVRGRKPVAAKPRAPPFLRSVLQHIDPLRRNNETLFASGRRGCGAGIAAVRGRFLRLGFLHD
ncbi:MAG TPA: DUF2946 domain-containing protein [Burkholderiales bacterium]|nr:DUF2946 domain-containing protein [Burkholderiales bacterium]